jgi:uncharacterized protein (DUF1330 family)
MRPYSDCRTGSLLEAEQMKTYLINHLRIPAETSGTEAQEFMEQLEATVERFGGKWLALGEANVVSGTWPGSVVLMEFPALEDARAWYTSEDYQAVKLLRTKSAISDLLLVGDMPSVFTAKVVADEVRSQSFKGSARGGMAKFHGRPNSRVER